MNSPEPFRSGRNLRLRRGIRLTVLVLVLYTVTAMLAASVLFRVCYPRSSGVSAYHYTYEELGTDAPQRVSFTVRSGNVTLRGWRYDAPRPKGLIAVINGLNDGADAHLPEIERFVSAGWSVLSWDATGVGRSEGRGVIGLQQIRLDLLAVLEMISQNERLSALPLILYGHSAGAYAAASVLDSGYAIVGAVCVSGFDSPVQLMYWHARQNAGVFADLGYPFLWLETLVLFGDAADVSASEAINAVQTPVLLIAGNSDDLVPQSLSLNGAADRFVNPNVSCLEISAQWRGEHNTLWLSGSAAEYVCRWQDGAVPDKPLANELDEDFMDTVLAFFEYALAQS